MRNQGKEKLTVMKKTYRGFKLSLLLLMPKLLYNVIAIDPTDTQKPLVIILFGPIVQDRAACRKNIASVIHSPPFCS